MEGLASKNAHTGTVLEITLLGSAEEVGSMWVFVISTPSEYISRYILHEGTWKFCQMDPGLVLLFPLLVGWAPYSSEGRCSLSSFHSSGQYTNKVAKNG